MSDDKRFTAPPGPVLWVVFKDDKCVWAARTKVAFDARRQAAVAVHHDEQGLIVRAVADLSVEELKRDDIQTALKAMAARAITVK